MKLLKVTLLIISLSLSFVVQAEELVIKKIKSELSDRLYPASVIIEGYEKPLRNAPTLAVADLRINNDSLYAWSKVISEILRDRIQFCPNAKLTMPESNMMYSDSQYGNEDRLLVSRTAFKKLYESQAIETLLTGQLGKISNNFELNIELIEAKSGSVTTKKQWRFTETELPETLVAISLWVYDAMGIGLTETEKTYLSDTNNLSISAIKDFVNFRKNYREMSETLKFTNLQRLHTQYPKFVLFAHETLRHRIPAANDAEAFKNLKMAKQVAANFLDNAGVNYRKTQAIEIFGLPKTEAKIQFETLKQLIKQNPNTPTFMLSLGYGLVGNQESPEGLSIMLEAVDRWPDNYRAWWGLSWGLNQYAWQIRGDKFWREVPKEAQEKFKSLSRLADETVNHALSLYADNGILWVNKLNTIGSRDGYSDKLMHAFDKAISHAPHNPSIYRSAMNYAQEKWDGNSSARLHIASTALKNNPDAIWAKELKERYVSASDELIGDLNIKNLWAFLKKLFKEPQAWNIVLLLLIVYAIGKWQGTRKSRQHQQANINNFNESDEIMDEINEIEALEPYESVRKRD